MAPVNERKVVIVGAGPAGVRAAEVLQRYRYNVTIVHEGPSAGGNIYRRQPPGFTRPSQELYGSEAIKADRIHETYDRLMGSVEVKANATVLNVYDGKILAQSHAGLEEISYDKLLIATGAMDRVIPLPGWTLPGVYTLGGSQIALKHQACAIGSKVVFFGTGPLLYLVAYQYSKAGANVAGVYDTTSFGRKARYAVGLLTNFKLLRQGVYFRRYLKSKNVDLQEGIEPLAILGDGNVKGFRYRRKNGSAHVVDCDAVGFGYGLKPEAQLAELAGADLVFEPSQNVWAVRHDGSGRVRQNVYIAGDCATIAGADAAELSGARAAYSILEDDGREVPQRPLKSISSKLSALGRFRKWLNLTFRVPVEQISTIPDDTILCRCENITFGEVRAAVDRFKPVNVNQLKAYCRTGMGRCQGRVCGPTASALLATMTSRKIDEVGHMRCQGPLKPVSYTAAAELVSPEIGEALSAVFDHAGPDHG